MTKIKLCGLTTEQDALAANSAHPDWVGLVFDKGRHFVTDDVAHSIRNKLDPAIPIVGVFANDDPAHIFSLVRRGIIQWVQLHGDESETYLKVLCQEISCPFIRAVSVESRADVIGKENTLADFLLLDHGRGGTGKTFDWRMIPPIAKPWFMAGGIGLSNLEEALSYHPYAVDISSGAETDGHKDADKMRELVNRVRYLNVRA